jgi:hypothetical protein
MSLVDTAQFIMIVILGIAIIMTNIALKMLLEKD